MTESFKEKSSDPKEKKSFSNNLPTKNKNQITKKRKVSKSNAGIPKSIADRMARRVALTSGLPTISGMGVFIGSYLLVSKGIIDIPPGVTLIISAICFLMGLIGLSYGMLSASWDISPGSLLGIENIRPNISRLIASIREKD